MTSVVIVLHIYIYMVQLICFSLEKFKEMNPAVDLVQGAVIEMTIQAGNYFLYKSATGRMGSIRSEGFCKAMLEVYYGDTPVSPTHKVDCIDGIKKL